MTKSPNQTNDAAALVKRWTPGPWTPGPWDWWDEGHEVSVCEAAEQKFICSVMLPSDARLIAAAPDYAEAAEMLLKWFDGSGSGIKARWERIHPEERLKIINAFRAARAKARGES